MCCFLLQNHVLSTGMLLFSQKGAPGVPMGRSAGLGGSLQFLTAKRFKPQYFWRRACCRAGGNLLRSDFFPRRLLPGAAFAALA